jgi:hypothetical protein
MIVCSTGAGSARPVVSMTMRRNGAMRPLSRRFSKSSSVETSSPRIVQHRHPDDIMIMSPSTASISR